MNTRTETRPTALDLFGKRHEKNRLLLFFIVLTTAIHAAAYWHLASRIAAKPQFLVMDQGTFYLPKSLDFSDAKELHVSQAGLLMESLLDRGPDGLDHPERLKRLTEKGGYQEAMKLIQKDAESFQAKKLHQKVEVRAVQILQAEDDTVMVAVDAQLIRMGEFGDGPFQEALSVKAKLLFVRNPSVLTNGAFPTLLRSLKIETIPIP